jgi:hypothetical protein
VKTSRGVTTVIAGSGPARARSAATASMPATPSPATTMRVDMAEL